MSPDDVIKKLAMLGVKMTRRTLLNYEKWGVISKAERGGGGPGGMYADYPDGTVEDAFAGWALIHGKYTCGIEDIDYYFEGKAPRIAPFVIASIRESRSVENDGNIDYGRSFEEFYSLKEHGNELDLIIFFLSSFVLEVWRICKIRASNVLREKTSE